MWLKFRITMFTMHKVSKSCLINPSPEALLLSDNVFVQSWQSYKTFKIIWLSNLLTLSAPDRLFQDCVVHTQFDTVNREILVMVLFWPILAPKYEVPKLNIPKYVTLQKLTAKIEHCLNIFLYLYFLVCTFLSYFFPK